MTRALALILVAALALPAGAGQVLIGRVTRVVDADTFDVLVEIDLGAQAIILPRLRVRLDCVNTPEKWTPEGARLARVVRDWIEGRRVAIEVTGDGGFSRVLGSVRPEGWTETLEHRLYHLPDPGTPLYTGTSTTAARINACRNRLEAHP